MKAFFALLFLMVGTLHAQQPGVDCAPIQGQGWTGCAPINSSQPSPRGQQSQTPQAPPELWQDHWGAIATYEPSGVLGVAANMQSESQAKQAAMADCQAKSGGSNCKFQLSYRNGCAAMVLGDKVFNVNSAGALDQAVQKGMAQCSSASSNCHVYYSACSLPVRIQ